MTLDDDLKRAADELRQEVMAIEAPAFEPPRPGPPRLAAAVVAVVAVGGLGWALLGDRGGEIDVTTEVDVAGEIEETTDPTNPEADLTVPTLDPTPPSIDNPTDDEAGGDTAGDEGAGDTADGETDGTEVGGPGVTDRSARPTSALDRPGFESVIEPDFGTSLRRVTDGESGSVTRPVFSGTQAFNADGSFVLLYRTRTESTGHVLYDGRTLAEIGPLAIDAVDIEDVYWDRDDPTLLRYLGAGGNELIALDVTTGTTTVDHRFDGCSTIDTGETSGTTTSGSDLLAVICRADDGTERWISYDLAEGAELARVVATAPEAPIAAPSGERFVVVADGAVTVLDRELQPVGPVLYEGDLASVAFIVGPDGGDLLLATLFEDPESNGLAVAFDPVSGERTDLIATGTDYAYPAAGTRLTVAAGSGSVVAGVASPVEGTDGRASEIVLVDPGRPDGPLVRLAHHRMSDDNGFGPWRGVEVAVSPDGTRVLFASDWGTDDTIDTYLIELPG